MTGWAMVMVIVAMMFGPFVSSCISTRLWTDPSRYIDTARFSQDIVQNGRAHFADFYADDTVLCVCVVGEHMHPDHTVERLRLSGFAGLAGVSAISETGEREQVLLFVRRSGVTHARFWPGEWFDGDRESLGPPQSTPGGDNICAPFAGSYVSVLTYWRSS